MNSTDYELAFALSQGDIPEEIGGKPTKSLLKAVLVGGFTEKELAARMGFSKRELELLTKSVQAVRCQIFGRSGGPLFIDEWDLPLRKADLTRRCYLAVSDAPLGSIDIPGFGRVHAFRTPQRGN